MRAIRISAVLVGLWLAAAAIPLAQAFDSSDGDTPAEPHKSGGYARELALRYHFGGDGQVTASYAKSFEILNPAGIADLREIEIGRRLLAGHPDRVRVRVQHADGSLKSEFEPRIAARIARPRVALRGLAVGDRIEISAERRLPQSAFPLGVLHNIAPQRGYAAVRLELSVPEALIIHHEASGFTRSETRRDGERHYLWQWRLKNPNQPPESAASAAERSPRIAFSRLANPAELAGAIADRLAVPAADQAALSAAASQALAEGPAGQSEARTIFAWLVKAISVKRLAMEAEAPIFRSPAEVLASRTGHHVEVANLYRALLAARGVASDVLLSNRRPVHRWPGIGVAYFNATLVHIPDGDLYADPATGLLTVGHVPTLLAGKFALAPGSDAPERLLPKPSPENSGIRTVMEVAVQENGDVEGHSRTIGYGGGAALLAEAIGALPEDDPAGLSRQLLERQLLAGRVQLLRAREQPRADETSVDLEFRLTGNRARDNAIRVPLAAGPRLIRRPLAAFLNVLREGSGQSIACTGLAHSEELLFHLPATGARYQAPENAELESRFARYSARYVLSDLQLRVERRLELRFPGPLCPPDIIEDIAYLVRYANFDQSRRITIFGDEE